MRQAIQLMLAAPLLLSSQVWALGDTVEAPASAASAPWLDLDPGARSLGLGGAGVSAMDGTDALGVNPALLSRSEDWQLSMSHHILSETMSSQRVAMATGLGGGGLGFSVDYVSFGAIENNTLDANGDISTGPELRPQGYAAALGYGHALGALDLGLTARLLGDDPDGAGMANGFSGDLGLAWAATRQLGLGVSLTQLGPQLLGNSLPTQARMGFSWSQLVGESAEMMLALEERIPTVNAAQSSTHVGLQTVLGKTLSLRGGYEHLADLGLGFWRLGLGAALGGYRVDYAYAQGANFDATHLVTLSVDWSQAFGLAQAALTAPQDLAALATDLAAGLAGAQ